jgi:glucose/arabinose dehydrogenase
VTSRAGSSVAVLAAATLAIAACGSAPGGSQSATQAEAGNGGVRLEKIGDFNQPVYVAAPPGDARDLFVVEQPGKVIVVHDGQPVATPFLDLSRAVSCCGEQGLLSIAFAPDYERSGLVYADYTDVAGDTRVVEYRRASDDPLTVDPASARRILSVDQPYSNHNGGQLEFGPDGLLYVGLGDGGPEGDPNRVGQDPSSPLSKILTIDTRNGNGSPRTFASGLRNPWRFSFDRQTGALWIGDVGQDRFEEVDGVAWRNADGANFGWSAFEGDSRYNQDQTAPDALAPVLTYSHADGCSVIGGYVVRDRAVPSLYGRYLYGDHCAGVLRSFTARPGRLAADDRSLGIQVPSLSSFGEDSSGHVYAVSLEGPVYRLAAGAG